LAGASAYLARRRRGAAMALGVAMFAIFLALVIVILPL
jgi:hypothetical protein